MYVDEEKLVSVCIVLDMYASTQTHTHTYMYAYIFRELGVCICTQYMEAVIAERGSESDWQW